MFAIFSKEKIFRISLLTSLIMVFVFSSFYVNDRFKVSDLYSLYKRKSSEQISYIWSQKVMQGLKNPGNLFSMLAGVGYWESGNLNLGLKKAARSVPVLVYHGLPTEGDGQIPDSTFIEQMKALSDNGWQTITLEEFKSFMKGELELNEKSFLLTFDDGRKDTFYPADPVLRDFGFHAVMFAISKKSTTDDESTYYMTKYELADMEKSGRWEVESHGRDSHDWYNLDAEGKIGHFFSNRLWLADQNRVETEEEFRDRIIYDLSNSKKDLESVLNKKITTFAFPFSDFGQDSVNYEESVGVIEEEVGKIYDLAFYQVWKSVGETFNFPSQNFMAKRIEPTSEWRGQFLIDVLESGISKDLPYESNSFGMEWIESWGTIEKTEGLTLKASDTTTGASSVLNGSNWWKDYIFTADVEWNNGSNIVLMARRGDDDNYYACNFSKNKVSIKRSSGGSSFNILTENYYLPSSEPLSLGIKVQGTNISCLVNDLAALSANSVNSRIPNGGIGIEIWDQDLGVASAKFENISVLSI